MHNGTEAPSFTDDNQGLDVSELFPVLYAELKRLALFHMASERGDHTLTPTGLLHEAWLRLSDSPESPHWQNRAYFFTAVAEAMRRILVEHARQHNRRKLILQSSVYPEIAGTQSMPERPFDLVAVDEALTRLTQTHPEKAELVKLRFFGGMTLPEAAEVLGISLATANRHWAYARAWLGRELTDQEEV